jgi:23S rRNA (pseudouridine1915-N3)-methyltransferase
VKVRVVWLGRPSASRHEAEIDTYRRRVDLRWPAEDRPLRPAAGGRDRDPARSLRHEAETFERHREPGWKLVALDERGRTFDSPGFARWLGEQADRGAAGVMFAVGSDLGLDQAFADRADERLSLSALTLTHLLARLVLWEQLFRATQILGGGSYHRDSVQ